MSYDYRYTDNGNMGIKKSVYIVLLKERFVYTIIERTGKKVNPMGQLFTAVYVNQ